MMMQCPRCSTRWRVAAAAPVENPLFKCGRCHHLFRQFPGAAPVRDAAPSSSGRRATATAPPVDADTLEFIFPERQPAELLLADEATVVAEPEPAPIPPPATPPRDTSAATTRPLTVEPPPVIIRSSLDTTVAIDTGEEDEPEPSVAAEAASEAPALVSGLLADALDDDIDDEDEPALADFDDDLDDDDTAMEPPDTGRRVRVEDTMRPAAGFGTIMRGIGTAVSAFAVLALLVRVAPERATTMLARLPLAGASFANDRNLASKVELTNVHGRFQRLRNARRVFVISGDARNDSPLTIERIEVAGALYGLGGGELDQKVVTTGNRTTLSDLSEAEIVLLQRLDPAIALAPGESTPFLIVFLEPPRDLREFSSRVLSVRPTRRASTRPGEASRDSVG